MKARKLRDVPTSPLTLCGVEWGSPEVLIASAPLRRRNQSYEIFFKSLQKWAKPLLKECEKIGGPAIGRIDIDHPAKSFIAAINNYLDQWKPITFDQENSAHSYTEGEISLFKDGKIDVLVACDLIWFAWEEHRLPPPPVISWMMEGFKNLSEGMSADECFGFVKTRGSKKTVWAESHRENSDLFYAFEMALLIDNGLDVEHAAALLESQYLMFEEYGLLKGFNTRSLDAVSIVKYWRTDWKTRFKADLKNMYHDNIRYQTMRNAGEINFQVSDTPDQLSEKAPNDEDERGTKGYFHGQNLCFPSEALKAAIRKGLKVKIK